MTFVAEPFGLFVNDLLMGLTGGVVREGFRFLPEEAPFRLDPPAPLFATRCGCTASRPARIPCSAPAPIS